MKPKIKLDTWVGGRSIRVVCIDRRQRAKREIVNLEFAAT